MFHWICPECGREIPPAVTECPACDPKSAAEAGRPAAAVSHPESAPDLLLALAEQIRAAQIAPAATAVPAPPPVDQVVPQAVPEQVTEKAAAPPPQLAAPEEPKAEPVVIASTPAGLTELANALGLSESPSSGAGRARRAVGPRAGSNGQRGEAGIGRDRNGCVTGRAARATRASRGSACPGGSRARASGRSRAG